MFNKEEYIKSKKQKYYTDKYNKNKELVNKLQYNFNFDSKEIEEDKESIVDLIYDLEIQYGLVTKDNKKKRFLEKDYKETLTKCANISKDLKRKNLPFLAKIVNVRGEKGDYRIYNSIILYKIDI